MEKCILATGGAGYIGSHVVVQLMDAGYNVVILDNFENSSRSSIRQIEAIVGRPVTCIEGDVRDLNTVKSIFQSHRIDAVIHLAGKKAVGESVADPLLYFHDNLNGAISLLTAMAGSQRTTKLVFSSSATVYGTPEKLPIAEDAPTQVMSPYGRTKLMIEEMIDDYASSAANFSAVSLRYFNPVGAHESGLIGERPTGTPNNLFPYVTETAAGQRDKVRVFGNDYPTPDGTGIRDYIHVVDLARGHVAALDNLFDRRKLNGRQHEKVNLGTGTGHSVLDVIRAFSKVCGSSIPYAIADRRPGDVAESLADVRLASKLFGWQAKHTLLRMCRDHWRHQVMASSEFKSDLVQNMPVTSHTGQKLQIEPSYTH